MSDSPHRLPGALFVSCLLVLVLGVAGWLRLQRPVVVLQDLRSGDAPIPDSVWPLLRIDVNSADEAQLDLLPGIGPRLATRIVQQRRSEGPFTFVDDLERVSGLGPRIIERLRPYAVAQAPDVIHTAASPGRQFPGRSD